MATRWRYVPPNMVTCLSMTAALISISESLGGRFPSAAWFMLLCVLMDKLDGTLARLLKASSRFGVEMDSLADLISFGVAPAVLVLATLAGPGQQSGLEETALFKIPIHVGCFLYVIAAALRLAKFNLVTESYGREYFFGIPTTLCGAVVGSYYLAVHKFGLPRVMIQVLPGMMALFALLMVSRIPLPKLIKRRTRVANIFQWSNVLLVYLFGLIRVFPEYLLTVGTLYLLVGVAWAMSKGIRPPTPEEAAAEGADLPSAPLVDQECLTADEDGEMEPESPGE